MVTEKTEKLTELDNQDDPTTLSEDTQRRWWQEELHRIAKDMEKNLRTGLCRTLWIVCITCMTIIAMIGLVLWGITYNSVKDMKAAVALQAQSAETIHEQVKVLETAAAKRDDMESLARKLKDLQGAQEAADRAADRDAHEFKKAMEELGKTQNALMQMVAGLSTRVSQEEQARDRLVESQRQLDATMQLLNTKLRKLQQ